jgi:hypothetical protein
MKSKFLLIIGLLCGFIPLIVGVFIFFTWWIARAFFAIDLENFPVYGFFWIPISITLVSTGLILLLVFLIKNYSKFLIHSLLGILLVLINIPIAFMIIDKQSDIDARAYFIIYNKTKQDVMDLTLKSSTFEKSLGSISDGDKLVDFYYPKLLDERGDSQYPTFDPVTLVVKEKYTTHHLTLPRIKISQCVKLYLDDEFRLLLVEKNE